MKPLTRTEFNKDKNNLAPHESDILDMVLNEIDKYVEHEVISKIDGKDNGEFILNPCNNNTIKCKACKINIYYHLNIGESHKDRCGVWFQVNKKNIYLFIPFNPNSRIRIKGRTEHFPQPPSRFGSRKSFSVPNNPHIKLNDWTVEGSYLKNYSKFYDNINLELLKIFCDAIVEVCSFP